MEQDTGGHSLVSTADHDTLSRAFSLSDSDLLGLQNGSAEVLGDGANPDATSNHLSQGDLEALASIQEELDRMGTASSQASFVEGIVNPITSNQQEDAATSLGLGLLSSESQMSDSLVTSSMAVSPAAGQLKLTEARPTVRVVKRPSSSAGPIYTKLRKGETGQQFRIVSGQSLNNIVSIGGGQQIKLVSSSTGGVAGGNLKTIVPSENSLGVGLSQAPNMISIVNKDGSLTKLPINQAPGLQLATSSSQVLQSAAGGSVKIASKPQQVRILPSQPQTFKILNADGSLSDISSSFIRPKSDLKTITSVNSSPKKKLATYTLKSPQKMQVIKPESGQILRTSDGRLITLQGAKKVVLPTSNSVTSSPTKIVFRDAQGKAVNGSIVLKDGPQAIGNQSIVVKTPEPSGGEENNYNSSLGKQMLSGGQTISPAGGQLIRLTPEIASSLASNSDNKVQFVRVVGGRMLSSASGGQSLQIKGGQPFISNVQGPPVTTNNVKEELDEDPLDVKPQIDGYLKEKPRSITNIEPQGVRPRKPCNCTKSQCLKLYCDCFANGEFCFNCNCNNCLNNLQNEEERQRSIKQCLDRNPNAFKPKIGKNSAEGERRHNKGCNCKRSGCLKNYCECYEAKIPCTINCKCVGCKNVDTETGAKVLCSPLKIGIGGSSEMSSSMSGQTPSLNVNDRWFKASTSLKSKLLQASTPLELNEKGGLFSFVTQDVVTATCQCLLERAEECEKTQSDTVETEKRVLEEFGVCLAQIIEASSRSRKPPLSQ